MKQILKIILFVFLTSSIYGQDNVSLYPHVKKGLYGYINNKGKTIIKPQFYAAGLFSEGLAPVRLEGRYGYINPEGKFVINPQFDLALSFTNGVAKVFIEGQPYFINKSGGILFEHNYKGIKEFGNNSFAIVITESDKYGAIDKTGRLIIDTVFAAMTDFTDGVSIVTGFNHYPYSNHSVKPLKYERGLIDTLGNWIVDYGEYKNISYFKNGFAEVELIVESQRGYYDYKGVIDNTGKYRFTIPSKKWRFDLANKSFFNDIAIVDIYSVDVDTIRVWSSRKRYTYKGAINTNGEVILSNTDWDELTPFTYNRAFAKTTEGSWVLVNTEGKLVSPQGFKNILYKKYRDEPEFLFQNGNAFVKTENGWGAIDTNGRFVIEPTDFDYIEFDDLIRRGNIVFFEEDISIKSKNYSYRYGFWNTENNKIIKLRFHDININGFNNDLIYAMKDAKYSYINQYGKEIWKEPKSTNSKLNIDFMNRGYYYASSNTLKNSTLFSGWGKSDNSSKQIKPNMNFISNTLQVIIDSKQKTKWSKQYDANKLFIANTSSDTMYFASQDSRILLKIQAQNSKGEWKDIEYLPNSWCGNSYHTIFLAPNEFWEFSTPIYQGEFKTKIRAELIYMKTYNQEDGNVIYSNEIDAYINPGQFWYKRDYNPSGLMDPYDE